jgi:hypothetical protein
MNVLNQRGPTGIINRTGLAGSSATLVDCRSEDFLDNIEDGIKSTVRVLIDHGYLTISSCEGHADSYSERTVSVIASDEDFNRILLAIVLANADTSDDEVIRYFVHPLDAKMNLYRDIDVKDWEVIDILFGGYDDKKTIIRQECFERQISLIDRSESMENERIDDAQRYLFRGGNSDQYA